MKAVAEEEGLLSGSGLRRGVRSEMPGDKGVRGVRGVPPPMRCGLCWLYTDAGLAADCSVLSTNRPFFSSCGHSNWAAMREGRATTSSSV